jgi:uncharacterized protein (DUF2336 family)
MTQQNAIISELEDALADGSADRRIKTLRRVTDLFVFGSSHFSADHVTLFDGVFSHLIANVELSAREALAQRLAPLPNAPPSAIRKLAFDDEISVAGPVLEHSPQLENAALIENALTKSQKHLLAISNRRDIAETVTDVLVERGDRTVALNVIRNKGARFSETGYLRLIKRSEGDDELTRSVGSRPEIRRQHFLKLLSSASNAVRTALEAAHPEIADEIRNAVGNVAAAIQEKAAVKSRSYVAARKYVEALRAKRALTESDVAAFAGAGKFEETAVTLAMMCALPVDVIERVMVQDLEETIMIVAKAIGLSWSTVKVVLRLCAGDQGLSEQALGRSLAVFSKLKQETAQQVVEFQRRKRRAESGQPA